MTIQEKITQASADALRGNAGDRRRVLSFLQAGMQKAAIDKKLPTLSDAEALAYLQKARKQTQETLEAAEKGSRTELATTARAEIAIIEEFLPAAPSEERVNEVVREVIAETGAASMKDMGKVMAAAVTRLEGVDKGALSKAVKAALGG